MDPTTLQTIANQVIMLLTLTTGEVVADKIVNAGFEKGKQLYQAIFHRFQKVPDQGRAVKVLENFKDDPEEYAINLRTHLLKLLQADPQFGTELQHILGQSAMQEILVGSGSVAQRNKMNNTTGKGIQRMQGDHSYLGDNEMHMG